MRKKYIEPSILPIDKNLKVGVEQLEKLKAGGIEVIHYDVMDNIFVKNLSFETEYFDILNQMGFIVTVHLMVQDVKKWAAKYYSFKPYCITFHCEAHNNFYNKQMLKKIRKQKIRPGIAIKCTTDIDKYAKIIKYCDVVTLLSVEPGWGGQKFSDVVLDNMKKLEKYKMKNTKLLVQLDGGVNLDVVKKYHMYVDNFIMGSYIFNNLDNVSKIIKEFNALII